MPKRYGFALVAVVMLFAFAAEAKAQGMEIGFKLGVAVARSSADVTPEFESITTFGGGGHLRFGLTPSISLQPELLFVRKGHKASLFGFESEANVDYAEIPVLLRFDLPAAAIRPFAYAGPYGAFEVACKVDGDDCGDDGRSTFDLGAVFGAGFGFAAGPGSIVVEGRYDLGLKDVAGDPPDAGDDYFEMKNRAIGVFVGYAVPLGR